MNKFESRYANAKRIMNKINGLLDKGYLVSDDGGFKVASVFEQNNSIYYITQNKDNVLICLFVNDIDWDNGMHTPIPEFNKQFENWTYMHPSHIKKLKV